MWSVTLLPLFPVQLLILYVSSRLLRVHTLLIMLPKERRVDFQGAIWIRILKLDIHALALELILCLRLLKSLHMSFFGSVLLPLFIYFYYPVLIFHSVVLQDMTHGSPGLFTQVGFNDPSQDDPSQSHFGLANANTLQSQVSCLLIFEDWKNLMYMTIVSPLILPKTILNNFCVVLCKYFATYL